MTSTRTQLVFAASALGGGLLVVATPPFDAYPTLWLGMAVLAFVLGEDPGWPPLPSRGRVALTGARRGLFFGAAANLAALRFIPDVIARFTPLPWAAGVLALALLAVFEGSRWMVAAIACETLARARVPRALAFAAGVYAGTFAPTMLPWTVAGVVSPWPAMVQLADVCGERGVSFLMALGAGLAASGVRLALAPSTRARGALAMAAALLLVTAQASLGVARMRGVAASRAAAPTIRVALLNPGIGAATRWEQARAPAIAAELEALTARAEARGADLVVWPEAAYPYRIPHGSREEPRDAPSILGGGARGPVITGVILTLPDGSATNSAVLATAGGLSASYDKRHLLWFGETVPLADRLPWIRSAFARGLGLTPGAHAESLAVGRVRAAALICYEDILSEAGREAMALRPNLLVNLTNDAWFGGAESELHLRLAALRAVELRRDLVRAVNLGVSSWVDATGRVRARGSPGLAAVVTAQPALVQSPETLFARFGDAPWALLALVLANAAVWRASRRSP